MSIRQHLKVRSSVLRDRVNKYAFLGLAISFLSITIASILVSYQVTGFIDFAGIGLAQKTNPALWALDLTPFMFAYWGQSFCYELANTMETMIEDKTRELVNKSSDLESKLQFETSHDHLTNLPNHRLLAKRINEGIQQIHKNEELALILVHLNGFQDINYKYGSFIGNNVLVQFAEKLKSILLEPFLLQAYMGMNMVARIQGAEFALLVPRLRKEHHLEEMLKRLLDATSFNLMIDGNSIKVATTLGIALCPSHGDKDSVLLRHATSALFQAEKEGKSYEIYHSGMEKSLQLARVKLKELSKAIADETLTVLYQPEFELQTEKNSAVIAQAYFNDSEQGKMDIDQLLPLIEGTLNEKQLSHFMLKQAIQQLALWHNVSQKMTVRVTIFDATDRELPSIIENYLKDQKIPAKYLQIELTEKACLSDQTRSIEILKKLSDLGIKILISDFCSGYASFIYLTNFPIKGIKIDKSFILNMMKDEKKLTIVKAIIQIAETMKLEIYADGINESATLKKLKQLGCTYGQGSIFSPPVAADDVFIAIEKKRS